MNHTAANPQNLNCRHIRGLLTIAALLAMAGCATTQTPLRTHLSANDPAVAECAQWFETIDGAIEHSNVSDIAGRRVAGFPYLRINRFLEASKVEARKDKPTRETWIDEMRALDHDGRLVEIANLPQTQIDRLNSGDRQELLARTAECSNRLLAADRSDDKIPEILSDRARIADDYSRLKRIGGVYALTRLPFYAGVNGWQKEVSAIFKQSSLESIAQNPFVRYHPPRQSGYSQTEVADILARAAGHPLGMVPLSDEERNRLFATFAPVIEIETAGDFDRIGELHWSDNDTARVDVTRPVVYQRLGYTRIEGNSLLQLTYTAWLPSRPLSSRFDVLGGHLDGIVWRVTLAPDGRPLIYDSIHPCGCYHLFFPTPRLEPIPSPKRWIEWAFIPQTFPDLKPAETVALSLQSKTHYLLDVKSVSAERPGQPYTLIEYDQLRSMPLPDGGRRSLFRPDGLVAGSERGERFLFWPMGIASPGAMRQAGTQATAFVGRRHFDDADLIEKRFRLVE